MSVVVSKTTKQKCLPYLHRLYSTKVNNTEIEPRSKKRDHTADPLSHDARAPHRIPNKLSSSMHKVAPATTSPHLYSSSLSVRSVRVEIVRC